MRPLASGRGNLNPGGLMRDICIFISDHITWIGPAAILVIIYFLALLIEEIKKG